jgi:hypothetical protein
VIGSVEQVTVVVTATPPTPTGFPPLPAASINNGATISIPGPGCLKNCQVAQVATVNDFAIQGTPATVKVSAGNEATYTIQVQPSTSGAAGNIFPDSVSLSCGTLPANAQCAWSGSNPVPNLNNGAVTRILNIKTAPHTTTPASLFRTGGPLYALWLPIGGLALLGGVSRRRRWLLAGLLTILLGTISFLPACSSSPNTSLSGGTPAGTYTVNINATSGTATRTTSVQLIVQ